MRTRHVCLWIGLAACSKAPTPTPTPTPTATPTPSASAATAAATSATPVPPNADPEAVAIATAICDAAFLSHDGKTDIGCRSHPPFQRRVGSATPALSAYTGEFSRFCAIERIHHGSFTRAGTKQAVVAFGTCEYGDNRPGWSNAVPGSAVVVEESSGPEKWKAVAYEPDVNMATCFVPRGPGRDLLVCHSNLAAGSIGEIAYFFVVDFAAAKGERHAGTFAMAFGDADGMSCVPTSSEPLSFPRGLVSLHVDDVSLADVDKDGTDDLVVKVTRARAAPSPALDARVRASCKRDPMTALDKLVPPPNKTTLTFVRRGERFTASDATQKTLAAWQAETSEGLSGLAGVAPPALTP